MSYDDDNDLMQEIREKYGTRPDLEGTTETSRAIQDGVRSSIPESGQPGGSSVRREQADGRKARKARRDAGIARGSYKRKGRSGSKVDQGNRRVNSDSRPVDRKVQLDEREQSFVKEEHAKEEDKPAGLVAKPNAKERRIRQEQEQEQAARAAAESARAEEQAAPHFFRWLRLNNKRKDSKGEKDKPNIRTKPLSTKEAEEIRQPLIDALGDYFHYTDELMSGTSANGAQAQIWGMIDDEEIGILVDAWLGRAQKDARVAHYAVKAVNVHYELKVAVILAPRFYNTFRFYVDNGMRSPFPAARRKQSAKQRRSLNIVSTNN